MAKAKAKADETAKELPETTGSVSPSDRSNLDKILDELIAGMKRLTEAGLGSHEAMNVVLTIKSWEHAGVEYEQ